MAVDRPSDAVTVPSTGNANGPASGDIVIARDESGDSASYVISIAPGPPQVRCLTFEQAARSATAWAAKRGVATWLASGISFARIDVPSGVSPTGDEGVRDAE